MERGIVGETGVMNVARTTARFSNDLGNGRHECGPYNGGATGVMNGGTTCGARTTVGFSNDLGERAA